MSKITILKQPATEQIGYVGHELLLSLHVSTVDFEPYIIEWKLNGLSVPANQVSDIDQSLYIQSLTSEQFGVYTARVKLKSNPMDYVDINPITLTRKGWISIQDQSPTYIKKRLGEELDVFVTPMIEDGYHVETIWYHNHVLLTDDKIQQNNVHVDRMSRLDLGVYTCKLIVREDGGFVWASPMVVELDDTPPKITIVEEYDDAITVQEDGQLQLRAQVSSNDRAIPMTMNWVHNGLLVKGAESSTLNIPNVTPAHAGVWRLEVRQGETAVYSKDVKVTVSGRAFIRITQQPLNLQLQQGASGKFVLDYATNYKNVTVQWYVKTENGDKFEPILNANKKELWIVPATQQMNNNKYFAHIIYGNDQRISTNEATLLVGNPIEITITTQPRPLNNVRVGSSHTLTCIAESNYEHYKLDYQWYRGQDLLVGQDKHVLHFSAIAKHDEGQYKCVVSTGIQNHRIQKESDAVQVSVDASKPALNIDIQPKAVSVRSGGSWALTVKASTNDAYPPRYRWYKDGEEILRGDSNVYGEDHAQVSSSGMYTCKVSAGLGEYRVSKSTVPVRVIVSDDPQIVPNDAEITTHPQDAEVHYNQRVIMHAKASNNIGLEPHYQWYKDGEPISGANDETLVIEHAKPSDEGRYHAEISVAERKLITHPADLSLIHHDNINIIKHPVDVVAKVGQTSDIRLEAHAENPVNGRDIKYQWHKIQGNVDTEIQGATQKVYVIPHDTISQRDHEATYYAIATDSTGHAKRTEKVRVVFTTAELKGYVHPIPWRNTSFQYQGYWVMDEIDRCNREGLNWLVDYEHTKYPKEIETIAASLHHYSNTSVLESRNGYLIDGTQLF